MSVNEHVEQQVAKVAPNVEKWAKLEDSKKLGYLKAALVALESIVEDWGAACAESRRYSDKSLSGQGYSMGPGLTAGHLNALIQTYEALVKTGKPPAPASVRTVGDQKVAQVYPMSFTDKLVLPIVSELWMEPGKEATQGACRSKTGLCAILSAGNYEGPIDLLMKMFVESKVVVYARHANLAKSNAQLATIFAELVKDGYLSFLEPGIPNAQALLKHDKVDEMLMTGGCATYDKIVWGSDEAKKEGKRLFTKPCEAELGAVSPYIITPSDSWTDKQLEHHAGALVGFKLFNSSAVCASPQLLIVSKQWKHKEKFMDLVVKKFEAAKKIPVFYNGTQDRVEAAAAAYEKSGRGTVYRVKSCADADEQTLKPIIIQGLDEQDLGSFSMKNEAFAPVLVELQVDAEDEEAFLTKVAQIANSDDVFGSLSCSVMIHPDSEKKLGVFFDQWVKSLEWGTVAINQWGAFGPLMANGVWGAHPKHTPEDIQSGQGWLGNFLMLDHPHKHTLRTDFMNPLHPKGDMSEADSLLYRSVARYHAYPSMWRMSKLACNAVKAMF